MHSPVTVRIGAIGEMRFRPGHYAYCGRARRNLSSRLSRHMARQKKIHWHIDHLTTHRDACVKWIRILPLDGMTECELNSLVQEFPTAEPIPGFGCSDCRCPSHLTYLGKNMPDASLELKVLHGRC